MCHCMLLRSQTKDKTWLRFLSSQNGHCLLTSHSSAGKLAEWLMAGEGDVRGLNLCTSSVAGVGCCSIRHSRADLQLHTTSSVSVTGSRLETRRGYAHLHLQDATNLPFISTSSPAGQFSAWVADTFYTLPYQNVRYHCVCNNVGCVRTCVMIMPDYFDKVIQHLTVHLRTEGKNTSQFYKK